MKTLNLAIKVLFFVLTVLFCVNTSAKDSTTKELNNDISILKATVLSENQSLSNYFGDKLHRADYKLDSMFRYSWSTDANDWVEDDFTTFEQDTEGRDSVIRFLRGIGRNTKVEFKYNKAGNSKEESFFMLFDEGWKRNECYIYSYDEHGAETSKTTQYWQFDSTPDDTICDSEHKSKFEYVYNENNHITEKSRLIYNNASKEFVTIRKTNYTVSQSGNILEATNQFAIDVNSPLKLSSSSKYKYFDNPNKEEETYFSYNETTQLMEESSKTIILFNDNNQKTEKYRYSYNADSSSWTESSKTQYTYDENGNLTEKVELQWNDSTQQWMPSGKDLYYYSAASPVTSISAEELRNISANTVVYPNPFKNELRVKCAQEIKKCMLFNSTGQKVMEQTSSSLNTLELDKGVYILKVELKNGNFETIKLIKE